MLTRLKVNGFKNLVDIDLRFGPFTCIAGPNGIGKSNLLDAITFLSALTKDTFHEAALKVRSDRGRHGDIRHLFHRSGDFRAKSMRFEADMLIPLEGIDDLGQRAKASITYLRYALELRLRESDSGGSPSPLELVHESLQPLRIADAAEDLAFPNSREWRKSVATGRRSGSHFISTKPEDAARYVRLHQDQRQGKPRDLLASSLPRTVLSSTNASESPTATLARKEMESWRILQLEPSLLREPDNFNAPTRLSAHGEHLPATLFRMAGGAANGSATANRDAVTLYTQIANRLAELYEDVRDLRIDRDEKRELLTLFVRTQADDEFPARSLSDGTLRFLALSILEADESTAGLLCLEEPENGIHPHRIPYVIRLLRDMCTDVYEPVSGSNPLRQVIVNTHSPIVAAEVPRDSLLLAVTKKQTQHGSIRRRLAFQALEGSWWHKNRFAEAIAWGEVESYLGAAQHGAVADANHHQADAPFVRDLVRDRQADQLPLFEGFE